MQEPFTEVRSLLAIDVGTITTRALLFDAVQGRYRFLAAGTAPTTAGAPLQDAGEGVRIALDRLQEITGRVFINSEEQLIMPSELDGTGVDVFTATMSAGPPIRVVAVGLLENVSVESIKHLASSTYTQVLDAISLTDRRKPEEQIDAILSLQPDLILIAGGTDDGATMSVINLIESLGIACYLMPANLRPEVLYAGNNKLVDEIKGALHQYSTLHIAPNIRPSLDIEQIEPAQMSLADIYRKLRARYIGGVDELNAWSGERLQPTASAFGRVIRFLSRVYGSSKGVLGVDIGATASTVAVAFDGDMHLNVFTDLGLGERLNILLESTRLDEITRWIPVEVSEERVREYIYNKTIYPASIPVTVEDLHIEQALSRQVLQKAIFQAMQRFPEHVPGYNPGIMPHFEPIIASGSVLTKAPTLGQSLLILLDSIQPTGITTLVLDQNNLAAALGVAATRNPLMVVQVLESSAFLNLATIISPVSQARHGTSVLRVRFEEETGSQRMMEIRQGALEVLPLPPGKTARLHLRPLHRADVGMGGAGRGGSLRVVGSVLGIVIDARGRPLRLPASPNQRRETIRKWLWTLGG